MTTAFLVGLTPKIIMGTSTELQTRNFHVGSTNFGGVTNHNLEPLTNHIRPLATKLLSNSDQLLAPISLSGTLLNRLNWLNR